MFVNFQIALKCSFENCWQEVNKSKDVLGTNFKYLYLLNYGNSMKLLPNNTSDCKIHEYPTYKCRWYLLNMIMPGDDGQKILYQDIKNKISSRICNDVNRMRKDWLERVNKCEEEMKNGVHNGDDWNATLNEFNMLKQSVEKGVNIKQMSMLTKIMDANEVKKLVKRGLFVHMLKQRKARQ